jgi:2-polyprenyl-6-methoxyphenol hydroxylase-like FAD-dependent oxidoreductase
MGLVASIGVIGGGTAGSAAALFLARAGHEVRVFERVADPKPVGAGIIVQPTGQAVLARLGLLERVAARAAVLDRLWLRTPRGRTLADLHYAAVDPKWFGLGTHRGVLFEALYEAAHAEVTITTGVEVRALRREGTHHVLIDANGGEHGPFELVVVADGSLSELRAHAGVTTHDTAYPWGALWFVAPDPDRVFTRELYQVAAGTRALYGVLPTGLGPRGDTPVVSLFWSLAADQLDAWRARGLEAWKREVLALDPRIGFVLDRITDPEQLTFARYRDVKMREWHDRGVVFIGDAAHATSPQLGQGANLALVDAMVLADAVAEGVEGAFALYSRRRRRHLRHYQFMTRALTPFFQSSSRLHGWLRDWAFPIANALPPFRNHMIRTMAGVSLGLGRAQLRLELR